MKRTALVTGGNRGIGLAICRGLVEIEGMRVLMGSRDLDQGKEAAEGIEGEIEVVALDLADRQTLRRQVEHLLEKESSIDVLVNNAGVLESGGILEASEEGFDRSLRVNLVAPFELIQFFLPRMLKNGYGRVVNVSSGWGSMGEGLGGPVGYSVSKAALNALTLSASKEAKGDVKINAMCPGWVRTRMGGEDAERSPEEGADTAVWLATLPEDEVNGGFFRDRERIEW